MRACVYFLPAQLCGGEATGSTIQRGEKGEDDEDKPDPLGLENTPPARRIRPTIAAAFIPHCESRQESSLRAMNFACGYFYVSR
jgi:hypothetical protein